MLSAAWQSNLTDSALETQEVFHRPNGAREMYTREFIEMDPGSENGSHLRHFFHFEWRPTSSASTSPERSMEPLTCTDLRLLFEALRDSWRRDTRFLSSATEICGHTAYRSIIAIGHRMVPFIVEDLRSNGGHWFHALRTITGFTPVGSQQLNMAALRSAWLSWADGQDGYPTKLPKVDST